MSLHWDPAHDDGDDAPNVALTQQLLDACADAPLADGSDQWRYLVETRGLPAAAVRYCSADLRVLEAPIPGFDQLARGVVSLLRDAKGDVTGLAVEAVGIGGGRVLDGQGRTARKSYALRKRGQIDALFRVAAPGSGGLVAYLVEGRLAKVVAVAEVAQSAAIYGWGGLHGLGCCLPAEPTVVVVEDAPPADPAGAEQHDQAMERGVDRLLLGGKAVLRAGPPPCGCCKDVDQALLNHPLDELRAWLRSAEPCELSLDGHARKCAGIKSPLKRAEAVARAIADLGLRRKPGMAPAFRKAVDAFAGKRAPAGEAGGDAEEDANAPPVEDVIPWPHAVDGAEVLDAIVALIRWHVNLPLAAAYATALWCAHSHALELSWFNPRLAVCSPLKRCGKTTLVEVLSGLVARAKPSSSVTSAVVFRMIDKWRPTYLIDEADGYLPENDELRSVLNSGHTRTSATVDRNVKVGDDWVPRSFSTWCPLVVAGIGRLPGTLDDRSVKIRLQRKPRSVKLARFRADRVAGINELGRKLARWVLDHQVAIGAADIEPPEELHDRASDNWRPLLALAHVAGGPWPARAVAGAAELEKVDSDADDLSVLLLEDIRSLFAQRPGASAAIVADDHAAAREIRLFTAEISAHLLTLHDRPWPECNRGRPLTQRGMSTLLRPFGIATHKNVRRGNQQAKGYALDEFLDTFARYLHAFTPLTPKGPRVPGSQARKTAGHSGTRDGSQAGPDGSQHNGADVGTHSDVERDPSRVPPEPRETAGWDPGTLGPQDEGTETRACPEGGPAAGNDPTTTGTAANGQEQAAAPKRGKRRTRIKGADTTPGVEGLPE